MVHSVHVPGNIKLEQAAVQRDAKGRFWKRHAQTDLNDRQRKALNRLLDAGPAGFEGGLTNRKYAGMNHVSRATAQRELADLVKKGILRLNPGGGRSASYDLNWNEIHGD